ncbi:MAG: hypothetical protein ACREMA_09285 [Longimicrobiales bacterium]
MKPLRQTALLALALVLIHQNAEAAQRTGTTAYDRARASLSGSHRTAFTEIVASAKARGLPTEPLVDKALEGKAKRVPQDRIIAVVRTRANLLTRAQGIARSKSPIEIIAVADALHRGVDESTIRLVRANAKPKEPTGMAVHAMADLLDNGVPRAVALEMISGWRGRGASAAELRELPAAVERLVREGANPGRAGNAVATALRSGRSASSVRMALGLRGAPRTPDAAIGNGRRPAASALRSAPSAARAATPANTKPAGRGNLNNK